jgi:predicted O-methyltransferase YrrM
MSEPVIPIFILAYNNPTHVKAMVEQVQRFTQDYSVVDNASTFGPMKDYLTTIEPRVIHMDKNYGHSVYYQPQVWDRAGDMFIITDPDLWLNPKMPSTVVSVLAELSVRYGVNKVGLALDITGPLRTDHRFTSGETIHEWESQFWTKRIPHETYELYDAALDTTFCLFNKQVSGYSAIRIAGDFTCKHRPWYVGWENDLLPEELDAYRTGNISSHYTSRSFTSEQREPDMDPKYHEPAGIEHYRLLEHFTSRVSHATIVDIGTYTGLSALALSTNPTNTVLSFDIEVKPNLPVRPNIQYLTDDLMTPAGRTKWKHTLLSAPFIFLDIDPHEGTREYEFYKWLRDNQYGGFVICDDIWYFAAMQDNFWSKIPDAHKLSATYAGHWSGTGLLRFVPGPAEDMLASFRDPDWSYGRNVLDMALRWHPSCEVARRIREAFYHVLQIDIDSPVENYLTDGTPGYSLRLLSSQDLVFQAGKRATHALVDGTPNGHAIFLLLLSNPSLTLDVVCETPLSCLSYLNTQFGSRISLGRTRDTYDLLHIDRSDPTPSVLQWGPLLSPRADCLIVRREEARSKIDALFTQHRLVWVESTPASLRAVYRHDSPYTPESTPPSSSSN